MEQREITFICITGSVLSLIAAYLYVISVLPGSVLISDITSEMTGRKIEVTGNVSEITEKDGNTFFTLSDDSGEIKAVLWNSVNLGKESLLENVKKGGTFSVSGEVQVYRGQLEIIVSGIKYVT